jgi:hypothetical protein
MHLCPVKVSAKTFGVEETAIGTVAQQCKHGSPGAGLPSPHKGAQALQQH